MQRCAFAFAVLTCILAPSAAVAQHRETRSAQLDRDAEFRIWNLVGSVRVIGWDVDSIRVEAELDDVARELFGFAAGEGGGKLTTDYRGRSGHADLIVRMPRTATVWIKTMSASVDVSGMTGSVDVYAVTGDVRIEGNAETVYAESMGGRVGVAGDSRVVRLRTGSGRIDFDGAAADLALTSVSGDILARASGLTRGIVESVEGRVHLGVSLTREASLEVMTHDGAVDLTLPWRAPVELLARTVSGEVFIGAPFNRHRGREMEGAATIEIRTFSGAIRVRGAQ